MTNKRQIANPERASAPVQIVSAAAVASNPVEIILARTKPVERFVRRAAGILARDWPAPRTETEVREALRALPPFDKIREMRKPLVAFVFGQTDLATSRILLAALTGALPTSAGCSRSDWICAALDCLEFDDDDDPEFDGFTPQIIAAAYRSILSDVRPKFLPPPGDFVNIARRARRRYAYVLENLEFLEDIRTAADSWRIDEEDPPPDPEWDSMFDETLPEK
ncbi:hypothetical protein IYX23_09220 [Methylocystis sp. L43]|uniref:hypothetical protein n=1 Tax=unclassified Methylocystis TaxID=2625913 RepID=UPI0018C2C9C6|nr:MULTISPECIES: hypothetical protein [unclassified Methylocystis]MBG0797850.1 hypothetical protein [Methylocystis sp. L43]MBG0806084.1 hypothetical protein [Methylocystis sp. H15]